MVYKFKKGIKNHSPIYSHSNAACKSSTIHAFFLSFQTGTAVMASLRICPHKREAPKRRKMQASLLYSAYYGHVMAEK